MILVNADEVKEIRRKRKRIKKKKTKTTRSRKIKQNYFFLGMKRGAATTR